MTSFAIVLFAGCFAAAGGGGGSSRPAVTPMLSELPQDPQKRDAILDSANNTDGGPERRTISKKQKKAETIGAFAAAIIGSAFSKTQNVTLGTATAIDENDMFEKDKKAKKPAAGSGSGSGSGSDDIKTQTDEQKEAQKAGQLMPWIKLK